VLSPREPGAHVVPLRPLTWPPIMIALASTSRHLLAYRRDVLSRGRRAAARWCCAAALERLDRNDASDAADANACRALSASVDTGNGPGAEGGTRNGHGRTFE
jgi:hypothetical protein